MSSIGIIEDASTMPGGAEPSTVAGVVVVAGVVSSSLPVLALGVGTNTVEPLLVVLVMGVLEAGATLLVTGGATTRGLESNGVGAATDVGPGEEEIGIIERGSVKGLDPCWPDVTLEGCTVGAKLGGETIAVGRFDGIRVEIARFADAVGA